MSSIVDEIEYKLDSVKVASVGPDDIDKTFRSTSIGMLRPCSVKPYSLP